MLMAFMHFALALRLFSHQHRMSTRAKVTLAASLAFSSFIIWAVHYQQSREREVITIVAFYFIPDVPPNRTCSKVSFVMTLVGQRKCGSAKKSSVNPLASEQCMNKYRMSYQATSQTRFDRRMSLVPRVKTAISYCLEVSHHCATLVTAEVMLHPIGLFI